MTNNLLANILLAYTIIGIVMWGGGVIDYADAGPVNKVADVENGTVSPDRGLLNELQRSGGIIGGILGAFGGILVVLWSLIIGLLKFIHWPLIVLATNGAPPQITLLLGAPFTLAFYLAVALYLRGA